MVRHSDLILESILIWAYMSLSILYDKVDLVFMGLR